MVTENLNIIEELKLFLETVSENTEVKNLFTTNESDFSRNRKLPLQRLVTLIINLPKRSLSVELQDFFSSLDDSSVLCTKGAFCQQRGKLDPVFFQVWNQFLVDYFYKYYENNTKCWKGFRLLAVDGSVAYLVNRSDVITKNLRNRNLSFITA